MSSQEEVKTASDEEDFLNFVRKTVGPSDPPKVKVNNDDNPDVDPDYESDEGEDTSSISTDSEIEHIDFKELDDGDEAAIPPEMAAEVAARFPPFGRLRQKLYMYSNDKTEDNVEDPDFVAEDEDGGNGSSSSDEDEAQLEAEMVVERLMELDLGEDQPGPGTMDQENMEQ